MNATAQSKPSIEREIASTISNSDRFIEASTVMISVSSAIPDDFMKMISIASGMKSAGETVFSIPQMIIDVTATILSVTDRLLSVPDQIVCDAARILSVTEIIISIRRQIPMNQEHGGFAAIDNYFRDGNDFVRDGNDSLKDGKDHFHRGPNFLHLAPNLLRDGRDCFLHRSIHFHRGHTPSRDGETFFRDGHDDFRLGYESRRDSNMCSRPGENPRRWRHAQPLAKRRAVHQFAVHDH